MAMSRCSKPFLILLIICSSCKTIHVLNEIETEDVSVVQLTNKEKIVEFIPMHHIGKPGFYDGVKDVIAHYKSEGFIVYYEGAGMNTEFDSATTDRYERKFRRMIGVYLDTTGYAHYFHEHGLFKKLVDQPRYYKLGISSSDKNVDVKKFKLVDEYEKRFGVIELRQIDTTLRFSEIYPPALKLPKENVMSVIIDYRNENLANYIQKSDDKKIVVVYGEEHVNGTYKLLKKMDPSWKRR